MEVSKAVEGSFERGDEGRFTGEVWLRPTLTDETGTNVGVVHFSPGARTHWHRHPGGQFLYAVAGRGQGGFDGLGIEAPGSDASPELPRRVVTRQRRPVRPQLAHGLVGVGGAEDAREARDRGAGETARVSRTIQPFS